VTRFPVTTGFPGHHRDIPTEGAAVRATDGEEPAAPLRVTVASGKGGTGKTLIATNLARVLADSGAPSTYVDGDIEAPNGHLFLTPDPLSTSPVTVPVAQVDPERCTACGACTRACRFSAILTLPATALVLDDLCHGCGGCLLACPESAITEREHPVGVLEHGPSGALTVRQGRLDVGRSAEHELLRTVLRSSRERDGHARWVIVDAPPGVGCTAAEAIRDADVAVLVTEPTPAGLHDLSLAVQLSREAGVPCAVVLNRAGRGDEAVRDFCATHDLPLLLTLPEDRTIARDCARGKLITDTDPQLRDRFRRFAEELRALAERSRTGETTPSGTDTPTVSGTGAPVVSGNRVPAPSGEPPAAPSTRARTDPAPIELVVLSGKGGTGKTSVTAALAGLAAEETRAVLVDGDVDAANVALLTAAQPRGTWPFLGGEHAVVDPSACTGCELCVRHCRFDALALGEADADDALGEWVVVVDEAACEGCGVCVDLCPDSALTLAPTTGGSWSLADIATGPLVHARLAPGQQNTGKLTSLVSAEGRAAARDTGRDVVLTDGPPGIGCPAGAALAGRTHVLLVTEPTGSGLHDLRRIADLCAGADVPTAVCLNKADLDPDLAADVLREATDRGLPVLGQVRYDPAIPDAHRAGRTVIDHAPGSGAAEDLRALWAAMTAWLPPLPGPGSGATGTAAAPAAGSISERTTGITTTQMTDERMTSMRIAVPVTAGTLSAHFGHCTHFAVFEVDADSGHVGAREDLEAPPHEPGLFPRWLGERSVHTVLAGGMGGRARDLFAQNGITVVTGVEEADPAVAVTAYVADTLTTTDNFCEK
jgi:MinD superfamily P-loop ATPase/predicted Fe-Mo cluster-binding NifX family protein